MARRRNEISMAEVFGQLRSDYDAARDSRFRRRITGISPAGSGSDYHVRSDASYLKMLELARYFDRNDAIVGQAVNRLVANVLQDGLKYDPQTGNAEADLYLWEKWQAWSDSEDACHVAGEQNLHGLARLALRHTVVDGDVMFLPLSDGTLRPVEAHRVRTPRNTRRNVVNGILLDGDRRRIEYWITRDDIDPTQALAHVGDMDRVPTRDGDGRRQVLHLYLPKRLSQTRGITAFAAIANFVGMHDDIQFAKLVQQQVVSCFAVFRERSAGAPGGYGAAQRGPQTEQYLPDGTQRTLEGVAPGMELVGAPGETLKGFSPAVPNAEFFQHTSLILSIIAINLDLPVAVLLLDPSRTNFSGWRGAIDQARLRFRELQGWIRDKFYRPIFEWKLRQWLAEGDEKLLAWERLGVDLGAHRWNCPRWPYIEPNKDIAADVAAIRGGITSPRRLHAEHGNDWEEIAAETVADNAYAIRAAKRAAVGINQEFDDGQPVHWRELIALPVPDGMKVTVGETDEGERTAGTGPEDAPDPAPAPRRAGGDA